jgi:hypothetical protein
MQELSGMSDAARDLAMARFRIQSYLERKRSLDWVAADAKICFRNAQRWVSQYHKLGLVARMTGANFRLLTRLLTQIERVLSVNDLRVVSTAVVEAARDSLVTGPGSLVIGPG